MKKILLFLLIASVLLGGAVLSVYAYSRSKIIGKSVQDQVINCLILGADESSGNTDVMILAGYQPTKKCLTLMQIPRDTYYRADGEEMKINHLYNAALADEKNDKNALYFVADAISHAFSVPIHATLLVRLDTLSDFVDEIGGIPMNVPMTMQYRDEEQGLLIDLPQGERVLTGQEAVQFVRFRADYLMGDIGRLDAQKIFLAALYQKLSTTPDAMKIAFSYLQNGACTLARTDNLSLPTLFLLTYTDLDNLSLFFLSMPGEASLSDGLWYYTPNKAALCSVLLEHFSEASFSPERFDPNESFCKQSDPHMTRIYFKADHSYKTYTPEDIDDIIITKKE